MWFKKGRYVYHYCAHYQLDADRVIYIDGIAQMKERITCYSDYKSLKSLIDQVNSEKLTIDSLTYLGR